jgi:putative transposase
VEKLVGDHGFSERRACRLIGANRSAWQYEPVRGDDGAARERLRAIANERRRFGYRRLAIMLRREGKTMNLKKIYRLYRVPISAGASTSSAMHWPAAGASGC